MDADEPFDFFIQDTPFKGIVESVSIDRTMGDDLYYVTVKARAIPASRYRDAANRRCPEKECPTCTPVCLNYSRHLQKALEGPGGN